MKIGIVGGGPGGLYFALLIKSHNSDYDVQVVEQNPADNTYGWGVVFSDRALSFLADSHAGVYRDVGDRIETWDDLTIICQGEQVKIDGSGFSGIARIELLRVLQNHAQRQGVRIHFGTRVTDLEPFADYDLLVGADGANSIVRATFSEYFRPSLDGRSNKYVWYGSTKPFDTLALIFRTNHDGAFVAHAYRYSQSTSTFIVECDAATWNQAGFATMSDEQSRAYCEDVFKADLDGHRLLSNQSEWINFLAVSNRSWWHKNVVLIGDALRTVHFSIGSGTRTALEDAIALWETFALHGRDVAAALAAYEGTRKPSGETLLQVANNSLVWYERFADKLHLDPIAFAYDYMLRGGRLDHESLRSRSPKFVASYEAWRESTR